MQPVERSTGTTVRRCLLIYLLSLRIFFILVTPAHTGATVLLLQRGELVADGGRLEDLLLAPDGGRLGNLLLVPVRVFHRLVVAAGGRGGTGAGVEKTACPRRRRPRAGPPSVPGGGVDEPPGRGAGVVKDAAVRGVAGSGGEEEAFVIVIGAIVVIGHGGPGPGAGVVKDAAVGGVAVSGGGRRPS